MTTLADPVPEGRPGDVQRADALSGELSGRGVHGIVLAYVDTAGIGRVKTIPTAKAASAAAWGMGMSPVFDTFLANDSAVTTDVLGSPDGDLRLDPTSTRWWSCPLSPAGRGRRSTGSPRMASGIPFPYPHPSPPPNPARTATERSQFPESMIKQCLT